MSPQRSIPNYNRKGALAVADFCFFNCFAFFCFSCYMKFDIIRRILEDFFNLKVHYIMGVTDIDDKIILKANVLKENFKTLAKLYEFEFFSDLRKLNILPPHTIARVSDHILEIQNCVDELMKKEVAYSAPDGNFICLLFAKHQSDQKLLLQRPSQEN